MRTSRLALAAILPAAALLVAACGTTGPVAGGAYGNSSSMPATSASASAGAPMIPAKTLLTVKKTKIGYVLATGTGLTLYWYGHDVRGSGKSSCTGSCLTSWPALAGSPSAAAGVRLSEKLGTITRPGGMVQATYNGYPLYTYAADTGAGQTLGNGVGGTWHVITGTVLSASPAAAASASARDMKNGGGAMPSGSASASASGSSGTGGGYGYP